MAPNKTPKILMPISPIIAFADSKPVKLTRKIAQNASQKDPKTNQNTIVSNPNLQEPSKTTTQSQEVENAKEKTPLTSHESIKIANDFAALKQSALRWIRHYINANTSEVEKHLLQEIAAGLKNLDSVNTQYAPAIMAALIRKLRRF